MAVFLVPRHGVAGAPSVFHNELHYGGPSTGQPLIVSTILSFVPAIIIMAIGGAILAAQISSLPPRFF